MANYQDTYYVDNKGAIHFLSKQDLQNIDSGKCPSPIKNSWVITDKPSAMKLSVQPKTLEQSIADISYRINKALDEGAKKWMYDNLVTCVSYLYSTNQEFLADAKALMEWRDNVWEWLIKSVNSVTVDTLIDDFMKTMPSQPNKPVIIK